MFWVSYGMLVLLGRSRCSQGERGYRAFDDGWHGRELTRRSRFLVRMHRRMVLLVFHYDPIYSHGRLLHLPATSLPRQQFLHQPWKRLLSHFCRRTDLNRYPNHAPESNFILEKLYQTPNEDLKVLGKISSIASFSILLLALMTTFALAFSNSNDKALFNTNWPMTT